MSLKHALLGFLNYRPMTGYELKQYFDQSIHHFWNASLSQIYPTLSRMAEEGLLTMRIEYQENRPNRKVYSITDAGREELQRWLREPIDLPQMRLAFLIQVFFGGNLDKETFLTQLRRQLRLHQERLAVYRGPTQEMLQLQHSIEAAGMERAAFFWNLTLEAGIQIEEGWIRWCREAIEKVEALDDDT